MSNETEALKDAAADAFDRFGEAYDALKAELAKVQSELATSRATEDAWGRDAAHYKLHAEASNEIAKMWERRWRESQAELAEANEKVRTLTEEHERYVVDHRDVLLNMKKERDDMRKAHEETDRLALKAEKERDEARDVARGMELERNEVTYLLEAAEAREKRLREALVLTEETLDIRLKADAMMPYGVDSGDALALLKARAALADTAPKRCEWCAAEFSCFNGGRSCVKKPEGSGR